MRPRRTHNTSWCRWPCQGSGSGATEWWVGWSAVAPLPHLMERPQHNFSLCARGTTAHRVAPNDDERPVLGGTADRARLRDRSAGPSPCAGPRPLGSVRASRLARDGPCRSIRASPRRRRADGARVSGRITTVGADGRVREAGAGPPHGGRAGQRWPRSRFPDTAICTNWCYASAGADAFDAPPARRSPDPPTRGTTRGPRRSRPSDGRARSAVPPASVVHRRSVRRATASYSCA